MDAKDAIQDLQDQLAEIAKQKFDNVVEQYEEKLSTIEHQIDMLEATIDYVETQGYLVSASYYEDLISTEKSNIKQLQKEYSALQSALTTAMEEGNIKQYSEDWYDMQSAIEDVESAILDAKTALVEYENALRQLDWDAFDMTEDYLSYLTDEADFYIDLMSNANMFDSDTGKITDEGMATLGLHAQD